MVLWKRTGHHGTNEKCTRKQHVYGIYINKFVDIAKHSQQLEILHLQGSKITKEMASHIMMQLPIKRLVFKSCRITESVAQIFVDLLKKGDHSYCEIQLFETKSYKWNKI